MRERSFSVPYTVPGSLIFVSSTRKATQYSGDIREPKGLITYPPSPTWGEWNRGDCGGGGGGGGGVRSNFDNLGIYGALSR